jgi:hypothetical protein
VNPPAFYTNLKNYLKDILAQLANYLMEIFFQTPPYELSLKYQLAFLEI